MQDLHGALVARDVQLVPRGAFEGATLVRADLGRDTESAQQAEGTPRD